jgi:anthraniloyl-CoA monooxygenase
VFESAEHYRHQYDLVVACDGINSLVRQEYEPVFKPDIDLAGGNRAGSP